MSQSIPKRILTMGDKIIGTLSFAYADFPWIIEDFKPTQEYEAIRHLFERENQLYDEQERIDGLLLESPNSKELKSQLNAIWNKLQQAETEIENLQLQINFQDSRLEIQPIHIRNGQVDYKTKFGK